MSGKQMASPSFTSNFAGMSKSQLYDIMSQMKILIEQNQQQARQILVENPALTKALFQAQIMLGMVNPPKAIPSMQPVPSQPLQQSVQPVQPQNAPAQSMPAQVGPQDQASGNQMQTPARKQANHLVQSMSSASAPPGPPVTHHSQTMPSHSQQFVQQAKGHMNTQGMSISHPQSSQVHSMPPQQLHSAQQPPSFHQSQVPTIFNQQQQTLHSSGGQHHPLQPPLPPQPRPPSMQPFLHQPHQQMGPHSGFQNSGASQPHHQQPPFSAANMHPGNSGFAHGQPSFPNQPPPQPLYQVGGSHLGRDFNNQGGGPMQVDRAPWMPGPPENTTGVAQLPGPPPLPGQVVPGNQPPAATPTPNEMERALLQQVMNLTPEQINLLPPEQRQQVFQLQQMLR